MLEGQEIEKKSLRYITGNTADWDGMAKECVSFANAYGGKVLIGLEDDSDEAPAGQVINPDLLSIIRKKIAERTVYVNAIPSIKTSAKGGEYIELMVSRNAQTIAATSNGKYYIRIADTCKPIMPDDIPRLFVDKNAFIWEEQTTKMIPKTNYDSRKLKSFIDNIRNSNRVSDFIKNKSDDEILEFYLLIKGDYLTNLGILWIGKRQDRATLLNAPFVQFIKYNERGEKVNKILWDDFELNPYEMIEEIMTKIPDWKESFEISDGIFRKNIPLYDEIIVRELIANALVHRVYYMRGDIFINLFSDRLEIHNPGLLPLGVTPENIISQSIQRNVQLAQIFYAFKLMEREGSGYDKIYEILLTNGKQLPEVREENDRVIVTIYPRINNNETIKLIDKAKQEFQLNQKELICLGLIAQNNTLTATELSSILDIKNDAGIKHWLGNLPDYKIILSKGIKKGTKYYVNPEFLRKIGYKGKTNLKRIEPHRLRELIREDLQIYPGSAIGDINTRIGTEISNRILRDQLYSMVASGILEKEGKLRFTKYYLKN
jgi:ATP-dependent DNA helicase RecG